MISPEEHTRRLLMLFHALWEAQGEVAERAERAVAPEDFDWFELPSIPTCRPLSSVLVE